MSVSELRLRREDDGRKRRYVVMEVERETLVWESEPLRPGVAVNRLVKAGFHTTDAWDQIGWADQAWERENAM